MPDLFFAYDCQNYARYLTMFSVLLANVDDTHPGALDLVKRGAISVARSVIPGFREDVERQSCETARLIVVLVERGFLESLETMLLINVGSYSS